MRANVMKLWMVMGAAAVVSGCNCDPTPECEDLFVTFESPVDGATGVSSTTDVRVKIANSAGAPIELESATLVSRSTSATEFSVPRDGTLTSGGASFSGVTLEPGPNLIKVTVRKKATACTGNKSITVEVPAANDPPRVLTFAYPQDTAMPLGTLNSVELPSAAQLRIDLTTQFALGGTVEIINTANNAVLLPATPVTNASFSVNVPATALADGAYSLFARITNGPRVNAAATNPEAVKMIALDRTLPTCALTAPAAALVGPNDDADTVLPGFQLRATGTANAKATSIELKLSTTPGQATGKQALTAGGLTHDFTLPTTGTNMYTLTVEATDPSGNVCIATRQIAAKFTPPTVVITSPTAAGSPYNSFNIPLTATVTGGDLGFLQFTTTIGAGAPRDLGQFMVPVGGLVSTTGSFLAGMQTVTAIATDAVGNVSAPVTQAINVVGAGFSIVFTAPASNPALLTTGNLSSGNYTFVVATSAPAGTPVTLKRNGVVIGTPVNTVTGGSASFVVPVTDGTYTFRAEIGTPVNFAEVVVTVDTTAPVFVQPVATGGATIINRAQDASEAISGAQRLLSFTASIPMGGRADICSNQTPAPAGAMLCADGAAGWWTLKANAMSPDSSFTFPEGTYDLKIVVVSGTTSVVSPSLSLLVDTIPPKLMSASFVGDTAPLNFLNIAELAGFPPRLTVALTAPDTATSIKSIVVRNAMGSTTPYNSVTTFSGTVTLNQNVTATEQDYDWVVEVTDLANNPNVLVNPTTANPLNTPAILGAVRVDKVLPTCVVIQPAASQLGRPDDEIQGTPAFDVDEVVTTSSDVNSITYRVSNTQVINTTAAVTGSTGTNRFTLAQTSGESLYDFGATCTDSSGNATNATPQTNVNVDLDAPTCALSAPTAAGSPYGTFNIATSVTVGGPGTVGRPVSILSTASAMPIGSLTVGGAGSASGTVSYPSGSQTITATVTDAALNSCTTAPVVINVNAVGCAIAFTAPTVVNGTAYITSNPFNVTGHSSNCGAGLSVTLFNVVAGVPTAIGTPQLTNATGDVSFSTALAQGGPYTLRLQINNGAGVLTETDITPVIVDTAPPTVTSVTPAGASLFFVAATNVNLAMSNYIVDSSPGAPADFTVVATNIVGAIGGSIRVVFNSAIIASQAITTSPETVTLPVSLVQNVPGQFEVQIRDVAGNVITPTNAPAVVDVIAPAAPVVMQSVSDTRAATAALSWMPTYDDGTDSASLGHAGYDLRWSTSSVTGNNGLALSADYFDSTKANQEMLILHSGSGIARNLTLPPLNTYYISVRAKDEVGNYSDYAAPTPLVNASTVDLVNPTAIINQGFGRGLTIAKLNGDTLDDLVVGAPAANRAYVYFGRAGFGGLSACAAPTCQIIGVPGTSSGDNFGTSLASGAVGDSVPSLIVGSHSFSTNIGRAFLYFGGANPVDTVGFVEFRGATAGAQFGRSVHIVGDIDGDGLGEILVAAPAENGGRGRVYIFKGRSKANWLLARTGNDGGTLYVPSSAANWTIEGPTPNTGSNFFGQLRSGFTNLGDINGDGRADFTVPSSRETLNRLYLFSGAAVAAAAAPITTGTGTTADQSLQALVDSMFGTLGNATGFGAAASGGADLVGSTALDLAVGFPLQSRVSVYADALSSGAPYPGAPSVAIAGTSGTNFGSSVGVADLNGDGTNDLVLGEGIAASSSQHFFYARSGSFDNSTGGFWQSRIVGTSLGAFIATGDLDGDLKTDVAMGDNNAAPGRVIVWH